MRCEAAGCSWTCQASASGAQQAQPTASRRRRPPSLLLLLAVALALCHGGTCLKLVVVPLAANTSPSMDVMAVAAEMAARGHSVTVAVSSHASLRFAKQAAARHSSNTTAEAKLRYLLTSAAPDADGFEDDMMAVLQRLGATKSPLAAAKLITQLQATLAQPCAAIVTDASMMQELRELQPDAVIAMGLPLPAADSDGCSCLLAHALDAASIDINGHPLIYTPLSAPQFGSGLTPADLATLHGAATNLAVFAAKHAAAGALATFGPDSPWAALRDAAGLPRAGRRWPLPAALARPLRVRERRACGVLKEVILSSWLFEYPFALQPHQVLVGPGSPRPPHPISPPELAAFFDAATSDGLVLVAFGTTIQASLMMSADDYRELAHAFASLAPTRVLWTLKAKNLPAGLSLEQLPLGPNTKVVPWADYNDVLGHPATRVVVTHCGIHSIYEAAFHGVPLVGLPLQREQAENGVKLAFRGLGIVSRQAPGFRKSQAGGGRLRLNLTEVAGLVKQVLRDPCYASAAAAMSRALRAYAKRRHPYQRAADEVELALHTLHAQQQEQQQQLQGPPASENGITQDQRCKSVGVHDEILTGHTVGA